MSDYTPIVDYAAKDALATGNPSKKIKGTEVSAELDAIDTAIQSKEDAANKNQTSGYCGLDSSALVPDAQIPTNILRKDAASNTLSGNLSVTGTLQMDGSTVWTAGNDGTGSGLDADTVDGIQGASFQLASGYTAADVLSKLLTVDGTGTGLDADLLDGSHAADFALVGHTHTGVYEPYDTNITKDDVAETITANWNFTGTPTYNSIEIGYRVIPLLSGSGGTAATSWRGKSYASTGGVTLPASTFAAGDSFVIYNNTASDLTVTRGASLTMYNYSTDSATVTVPAYDTLFVLYISATVCVVK